MQIKRAQEEAAAVRRVASQMAREVRMFWAKVEKVARLKVQMHLDLERKSAMDKHLQFMMQQTERYCNAVASKLTTAVRRAEGTIACMRDALTPAVAALLAALWLKRSVASQRRLI